MSGKVWFSGIFMDKILEKPFNYIFHADLMKKKEYNMKEKIINVRG